MNMIEQVQAAIAAGEACQSKLPDTLPLAGQALSGKKERHLINNLAAAFTPYVEVGIYCGGSLIAAGYENSGLIVGVDNFSWAPNVPPRETLLINLRAYWNKARVGFVDGNCWDLNWTGFRCCFYDGNHDEVDQWKALYLMQKWMVPPFVYMVDDWNWPAVHGGTRRGIIEAGWKIEFEQELGIGQQDDDENYHNGVAVFVLNKP